MLPLSELPETEADYLHIEMGYKAFIRQILNFLHLDLTKNLEYDRLTKRIMKQVIKSDSNCIDVGCHKGEILDDILRIAPKGKHFAFEPIPDMYSKLKSHFNGSATIFPYALSNSEGTVSFQHVKNAPAYSGLKKRAYSVEPDIEEIEVSQKRLDRVIPEDVKIDFIKIDVEGGEYNVMKGAQQLLTRNKPIVIFEFGKGASEYYGTKPEDLYTYLCDEVGLKIYLLKSYLNDRSPLSKEAFSKCYDDNKEYYFVAQA